MANVTSEEGRIFISKWEGLRLNAYFCDAGKLTCGIGHVLEDQSARDTVWTQAYAMQVFAEDLRKFEQVLLERLTVNLRQHEFDALVSLAFNIGIGAFEKSTLRRFLANEQYVDAALEMPKFHFAGGQRNLGLLRRRCAEMRIFLLADYTWVP